MSRILMPLGCGLLLNLTGCLGEPSSKKLGPGSSLNISINQFDVRPGVTIGFGSALAGPDPQRGELRFVLCHTSHPGCDPSPEIVPRQGYRLQTTLVTRAEADRASSLSTTNNGGQLIGAVLEIPKTGAHRPAPGVYRLEPRVAPPEQPETAAILESAVRTIEITAEEVVPSPLTNGSAEQINALKHSVPMPAIDLVQNGFLTETPPAAAELVVSYPSTKVRVVAAVAGPAATLVELVPVETGRARIVFVDSPRLAANVSLVFELVAGAAPATASEFAIVRQTAYDQDGAALHGPRFSVGSIR